VPISFLIHYRLALDVIGRNLVTFESPYEMVTAVRDAIVGEFSCSCGEMTLIGVLALMDAYRAGILHRDFSPGNIIITSGGRGLLIDWDMSKPLATKPETPRRATVFTCACSDQS
jgi:serine/threonine protein kinase